MTTTNIAITILLPKTPVSCSTYVAPYGDHNPASEQENKKTHHGRKWRENRNSKV